VPGTGQDEVLSIGGKEGPTNWVKDGLVNYTPSMSLGGSDSKYNHKNYYKRYYKRKMPLTKTVASG
jgi:hypothetical protein